MDNNKFFTEYWEATTKRNGVAVKKCFHPDAQIFLHDTNEILNVEQLTDDMGSEKDPFTDDWKTTIDRINELETGEFVTVTFHRSKSWIGFVTSFFTLKEDKIFELHEYYAPCDDYIVPQWRTDLSEDERLK